MIIPDTIYRAENLFTCQGFGLLSGTGIRELRAVFQGYKKTQRRGRKEKTMQKPEPRDCFPNAVLSAAPAADVSAVLQRVQTALDTAAQDLVEQGFTTDLAELFEADPLQAEIAFRDSNFGMCRMLLGDALARINDPESYLYVEGEKYGKVAPSTGWAITVYCSVDFRRARYRPASRSGESLVPTEQKFGLTEGGLTPTAARLSMMLLSSLTALESAVVLKQVSGGGASVSTLARLSAEAGRCLEECLTEVLAELRDQEELPENAIMLHVFFDGVMMRMNAEKNGDDVIADAGWREASSGTVSLCDKDGNKLWTRYIGRLPEGKKQNLKTLVRQEAVHLLVQDPDLELVVTADGEKGNWTFSKSVNPDVEVLDFWYAAEHLMRAADVAFGSDEKASTKWFEAKRHDLRHDPKGVSKVIIALLYLLRKGRGREENRKTLGYFCNNCSRMNYYHVAKEGYPIGSGKVEAANKVLVTHRLKRTGQSWGRDGGQGDLSFRALLKSDRFDRA